METDRSFKVLFIAKSIGHFLDPLYLRINSLALRELVANALIRRDFTKTTMHPLIEIFTDRVEITSPGSLLPDIHLERIIDTAPESRNELLASTMRRMGICEERGSGIDTALTAVEVYGLPPVAFINSPNAFRVIVYRPRPFQKMKIEERLRACYQHCCLKHLSGEKITNESFRKRLGLTTGQYPLAWKIISEAMRKNLVKPGDPHSTSKKYTYYHCCPVNLTRGGVAGILN